ncbi:unnamed protein product [Porites evermanni]|uniref:G-protein coupled receptors family 1 profile domain-containing protein n=1 Tax=Porites evermanni TaxID=104178 RepID=A0ABN8SNR7_9CNID|nr:unnamed protein product [Porites evermanni]
MMTILLFFHDKKLLKKSYNAFILCLAIADILTSILVITSPGFGLGDLIARPTNPVLGEIYCRAIWSRVFVFQHVFFSVYITLLLTIERWVAVVKPAKYNVGFKGKRVIGYIFFCWICSSSNEICKFKFISSGSIFRTSLSVFIIIMKMFFPCLSMIGLYVHMIVKTNNSPVASAESKAKLRGKMTRMIGIMTCILLICYSPNQIFLIFAIAGKAKIDSTLHHFTAILAFTTIFTNPLIYGLSNANYRKRYKKALFSMCPKRLGEGAHVALTGRRVSPPPSEAPATYLFDVVYDPSSSSNDICKFNFNSSGSIFRTSLSVFLIIMKLFFPCLSMIGLYIHMIVKTNNSPVASVESKAKLRGKMTRMIGIMTCILLICYSPNQIFFIFATAGKAKIDSTLHHFTAILNFITIVLIHLFMD